MIDEANAAVDAQGREEVFQHPKRVGDLPWQEQKSGQHPDGNSWAIALGLREIASALREVAAALRARP